MLYLLDTNVVSELRKVRTGKADKHVAEWADRVSVADLYLSAISVQELETGILLIERKDKVQGNVLRTWLESHVLPAFAGRILPVDAVIARRSAALHVPDPAPVRDSLIAATALVHGMTVVTRNVADFEPLGGDSIESVVEATVNGDLKEIASRENAKKPAAPRIDSPRIPASPREVVYQTHQSMPCWTTPLLTRDALRYRKYFPAVMLTPCQKFMCQKFMLNISVSFGRIRALLKQVGVEPWHVSVK